jgi:hypothetical protein
VLVDTNRTLQPATARNTSSQDSTYLSRIRNPRKRTETPRQKLIYIGEHQPRTYTVRRAGIDLEVLTVNVKITDGPRDLEARVRDAARLIVR